MITDTYTTKTQERAVDVGAWGRVSGKCLAVVADQAEYEEDRVLARLEIERRRQLEA